jgi:putative N6-adenine-specific DNA methylase
MGDFEIFATTTPGMEATLFAEVARLGFAQPELVPGGVTFQGGWPEVWRANLWLRSAGRVLARVGSFRAFHLAQLDKRARKFDWASILRADVPVRVEVTCRKSKIYHDNAARQRIERALNESAGVPLSAEAEVVLKVRIFDDLCTLSVDTSGESLHKRGHKTGVGKAPMRENMAAGFLWQCGYTGAEAVVDPMCGSGTFVIEAAEIAAGLAPGRARSFAFEKLATFDPAAWEVLRANVRRSGGSGTFHGSDRDAGAVRMATENAARAGIIATFSQGAVSDFAPPPDTAPGLVMVNPPYGARIGERKLLFSVYGALGKTLAAQFSGWRVGLVTSDGGLAKATGLPFLTTDGPIAHGGLKVQLYRTDPLP